MSTSSRFFANPTEPLRTADAHKELLACLSRINAYNPPVHTCSTGWTFQGFYIGPTSVACLFYRLSHLYPDLEFKDQPLLEWAQEYLDLGARVQHRTPTASNCGIANEALSHLSLTAILQQDSDSAKKLCSFEPSINTPAGDGSNEWLYGRAGYLYFLRLCRTVFSPEAHSNTAALLDRAIEKTVERILVVPQPWVSNGKQYLGAAHGTIGIICQVVMSMPSAAPRLQLLLSELLDKQYESGNFPSSLPPGSDRLVQFCHGGPGFIISLRSLLLHFPKLTYRIQMAISKAQSDIWRRGLLTKEPGQCHGIVGNALALDDDQQFMHFMSFMTSESMELMGWMQQASRRDDFASLFTGEAGRAWAWAVADQCLPRACLAYNDL